MTEPPAWLVTHPPKRSQFRHPRRASPSGVIVVHTAENTPDHVAFDGGAEAVARFIRNRTTPGSYCDLVDSDSCMHLVRYEDEAFHDGTGTNPHSYGLSIATRADVWPMAPAAWRNGAVEQAARAAARYAAWVKAERGILIPPVRISAGQARGRVAGFVTHAALDPGRRTDPGKAFQWAQFLARYKTLTTQLPPPPPVVPQEDLVYSVISPNNNTWLVEPGTMTLVPNEDRDNLTAAKIPSLGKVSATLFARIDAGHKRIEG